MSKRTLNETLPTHFSINEVVHTEGEGECLSDICNVPPRGWNCSRKGGHGGPCAASPNSEIEERKNATYMEDSIKRQPGCECQWEEGDSPCVVHGVYEEELPFQKGRTLGRRLVGILRRWVGGE